MKEPVGKDYAGPSGVARDSIWLTAEDLVDGRDVKVKIVKVKLFDEVPFQDGRVRKNLLALYFEGKERILGLNATNRKVLNAMFGNLTKAWVGQTVTLYVAEVSAFGETVKAVRIRNEGARAATVAEDLLREADEPELKP